MLSYREKTITYRKNRYLDTYLWYRGIGIDHKNSIRLTNKEIYG